jgi:hypothetical protein
MSVAKGAEMNVTLNIGHEVGNFKVVKYLKTYGLNNAESYRLIGGPCAYQMNDD